MHHRQRHLLLQSDLFWRRHVSSATSLSTMCLVLECMLLDMLLASQELFSGHTAVPSHPYACRVPVLSTWRANWDLWLENTMDPSHANWLHDGAAGKWEESAPMHMRLLDNSITAHQV